MQNYLNLLNKIKSEGETSLDRTGVGTVRLFGEHMDFDLSKGFPACTTKQLAFKSVLAELLFFLQKVPDRRILQSIQHGNFKEDRFDIWKGNCLDAKEKNPLKFNGYNMGYMYPMLWNNKIDPTLELVEIEVPVLNDYDNTKSDTEYDISNDPLDCEKIQDMWNKNIHKMCTRWKDYSTFISDIRNIPFFFEYLENPDMYVLDSSYYNSDVLSLSTAIFLPIHMVSMINPYTSECFQIHDKKYINIYSYMRSFEYNNDGDKGITVHAKKGHIFRPKLFTSQIDQLVKDILEVKENPNASVGRRIIMDSWNPNWKDNSVLGICHPWVQCFVHEGKLSLMFTMRSSDLLLGNPFNIASYAILVHMLAQVTGLEVGHLYYSAGDAHIYNNHMDAVNEQLTREPLELPTLVLDKSIKNIHQFTMDSIKLVNYKHHEKITAKMAV